MSNIYLNPVPPHNNQTSAHNSLFLNRTVWVSSGVYSLSNSDVETSFMQTGIGSKTIPANSLTPGQTINVKIRGYIYANNGVQSILTFKNNNQNIISSTGLIPAVSNVVFETSLISQVQEIGVSGKMWTAGYSLIGGGQGVATSSIRNIVQSVPYYINTTIDNTLDVTYKWGTASTGNSTTVLNSQIILN